MLPKNVDWATPAHCDYFAVCKFVETYDRPAMTTIKPMREGIFEGKLAREPKWAETFEVISNSYKKLQESFEIRHNSFGGYRLMYQGKSAIWPPTVLKRKPIGFVAPLPSGVESQLSGMSSERTGQQLLLLGPLRFVNSDCCPNTEYDFASDMGIVQLRVKKKICPGDEIFVKYGPEFFETNACL